MLWFYLALGLASFFMVSLLPGSIIKKLIPFVDGVILDSNKGKFCWLDFFLILNTLSPGQMNKMQIKYSQKLSYIKQKVMS